VAGFPRIRLLSGKVLPGGTREPAATKQLLPIMARSRITAPQADESIVADFTGMKNCPMANGNIVTDDDRHIIINMNNTVVLNIGIFTDDNVSDISAENSIEPDTGPLFEDHPANNCRIFSDKCFGIEEWILQFFFIPSLSPLFQKTGL